MLINNKTVKKNKVLRKIQRDDKRANRDKALERGSVLKRNIRKVVCLSSEMPLGEPFPEFVPGKPELDADALLTLLDEAGLTGNSGSGYPTEEKIRSFLSSDVRRRYIIINGAECEPGLLHDVWLLRHRPEGIRAGAELLAHALSPAAILLATRGAAEYPIQSDDSLLSLVRLPYQFPMGQEHFLIWQALGIKLDFYDIPAQKGILVLNVQTVFQLARIAAGSYDGGRYVTLANMVTGEARVAYVRQGAPIAPLLRAAFGETSESCYAGCGVSLAHKIGDEDCFDSKTTFAALVDEAALPKERRCRKCRECINKCPTGVSVRAIVRARQDDPTADISGLGAENCMGCGLCTYFCPAGKDPIAYIFGGGAAK